MIHGLPLVLAFFCYIRENMHTAARLSTISALLSTIAVAIIFIGEFSVRHEVKAVSKQQIEECGKTLSDTVKALTMTTHPDSERGLDNLEDCGKKSIH